MKRESSMYVKTLGLLFSSVCLTLASCSKADEPIGQGGDDKAPVSLTSSITASEGFSSSWNGGEKVSVKIGDRVNRFTAEKTGVLKSDEPMEWKGSDPVSVEAWFPENDQRPSSWEISANQKETLSPVFLYAPEKNIAATAADKKLVFHHQLAKVVVKVSTDKDVQAVTIGSTDYFATKAAWGGNGVWSDFAQNAEVTPKREDSSTTFSAYVIPQKIAANTKLIYATVDNQRMYYEVKEEMTMASGNCYTFTLIPTEDPTPEPVAPTLNSDKATIVADGEDAVTFTVSPEQATLVCETEGGMLTGNRFTTTVAKEYIFHAELDGQKSEVLTIKAVEPEKKEAPVLTADPIAIKNNGETSTLKVTHKGADVTSEATITKDGAPFEGNIFSSTVEGAFTFVATYEGLESEPVVVTVSKEEPLVLSASETTLENDGVMKTVFTVMKGEENVTAQTTLSMNGQPFEGYEFSSTQTGVFKFVATDKNSGQQSNEVTITVKEKEIPTPVLTANKTTILADGTDAVVFSVVPEDAVITCAEIPSFSGKTFTTVTPKTYHFTATYKGKVSNVIVIEAQKVPDTPMEGEVEVTTPDQNDGWDNQGSQDGFIEF